MCLHARRSLGLLVGLLLVFTQGCAVFQGGSSLHGTQSTSKLLGTIDLGTRVHSVRGHSPVFGTEFTLAAPPGGNYGVRNLKAVGGYRSDHIGNILRFEMGAEGAIGEPAFVDYDTSGLYLGTFLSPLIRIYGNQDAKVGHSPVGFMIDLVATGRIGHWLPGPGDSSPPVWDGAFQLAIRFTAISDLIVATDDRWKTR